jgi:hypothetical protein
MATISEKPSFTGSFSKQLGEMSDLIDWLWSEHDTSFVKAGDDKVYAFGGNNYLLVFDESRWNGLIEFITPKGAVTIKLGENGVFEVASPTLDEKGIKNLFTEGLGVIRQYYENRYWKTPKSSS